MEARDGIEPPSKVFRPVPFRFGFRAISHNINSKQGGGNASCDSPCFLFIKSLPRRIDERVRGESRLEESILASTGNAIDFE
jgi:hypothetical protein